MGKVLTNRNLWIAIAVWASFWLLVPFLDQQDLFDLVNGLAVATAVGVLIAYGPGAWKSLKAPQKEMLAGHYLVLGVITVCSAFTAHRIWQWVWRWIDKPGWMPDHPIVAWFVWIIASGYVVHLTSVGAIDGKIPGRNWVRLAFYVVVGLVTSVIAIVFIS